VRGKGYVFVPRGEDIGENHREGDAPPPDCAS
jgi:hypothetical protein